MGCVLLLCGMPAYAYIDPGTGSALIQGLIAAVAAVGITLRLYWHRVVGFFRRKKNKDPDRKSTHTPP
jgi:uncharacterized membrane protein